MFVGQNTEMFNAGYTYTAKRHERKPGNQNRMQWNSII